MADLTVVVLILILNSGAYEGMVWPAESSQEKAGYARCEAERHEALHSGEYLGVSKCTLVELAPLK